MIGASSAERYNEHKIKNRISAGKFCPDNFSYRNDA